MTSDTPSTQPDTLRCPTCGARQVVALECRRCKCDLSLVVAALRQSEALAKQCCRLLRESRFSEAESVARRLAELTPNADAARYLAVCHLLLGRFQSALDLVDASETGRT